MLGNILAAVLVLLALGDDADKGRSKIPPPIEQTCFSVTNYWPWRDGELMAYGGQADGDPHHTAIMIPLTLDLEWRLAAVPAPLLGRTIVLGDGRELYGGDTFGAEAYRAGVFWHDTYREWVIGVDVLTKEPLHYLDCNGSIR